MRSVSNRILQSFHCWFGIKFKITTKHSWCNRYCNDKARWEQPDHSARVIMFMWVHSVHLVHTFLVLESQKETVFRKNHFLGPVGYPIANVTHMLPFMPPGLTGDSCPAGLADPVLKSCHPASAPPAHAAAVALFSSRNYLRSMLGHCCILSPKEQPCLLAYTPAPYTALIWRQRLFLPSGSLLEIESYWPGTDPWASHPSRPATS